MACQNETSAAELFTREGADPVTGERSCVFWRCGDGCWGLPECQHLDRTPFYLKRMPTIEELERRARNQRLRLWGMRAVTVILGLFVAWEAINHVPE